MTKSNAKTNIVVLTLILAVGFITGGAMQGDSTIAKCLCHVKVVGGEINFEPCLPDSRIEVTEIERGVRVVSVICSNINSEKSQDEITTPKKNTGVFVLSCPNNWDETTTCTCDLKFVDNEPILEPCHPDAKVEKLNKVERN